MASPRRHDVALAARTLEASPRHRDADADPHGEPDVLDAVLDADDRDVVVDRIGDARLRSRCDVEGEVVSAVRSPGPTVGVDVTVRDGSGRLRCHFQGRDALPGVHVGVRLHVRGRLVVFGSKRCLLNPAYELVGAGSSGADSS